ncbi:MAG: dinitrogenase iron-molybdenum cofactor biosynthesis protein [Ruminococcus flavefaciens]|nr:dinitrogenase iron-molybdenum cofactor biosynthesis protein [Ruminococcus flavefaciens]MCM1229793.1 dinitrogenase iron-molybdenum cofactor biosynthesis protein [Ruminococcus flavefaciens]
MNQHFGHAEKFLIFEVNGSDFDFTEIRTAEPVCSNRNHDDKRLTENLQKIQDCKYLLVSRIGTGASIRAEQLGITPMELPCMIEDALRKVISFEQIQNLFERN